MTNASMSMPTRRVEMWFSGTAPAAAGDRGLPAHPRHPAVLRAVLPGIAGFFVAVIGWFAALFTGRLPDFAHNYLSGLVRWEIRVNAYVLLLTDQYPPFSFDDVDYPVRPILPAPGQLNRVAVLFRIILAVPAAVFAQIVDYGLTVPLIIAMWVVVIVTGRMPPTLYTDLRRVGALPGPLPFVVQHAHVGVRLGHVRRLRPAASRPRRRRRSARSPAQGRSAAAATATASRGLRPARTPAGPAAGAAVLVPVDRRADGDTPGVPRGRPAGPSGWSPPQPRRRPPGHPAFPGPCRRPPPGSAPRSRPRWSRCRPGGS